MKKDDRTKNKELEKKRRY